jgi:hypothetical protein
MLGAACFVPLFAGFGPGFSTKSDKGATWGDSWLRNAVELVPEIRRAHEVRDSIEHQVSPTGVVDELVEAFPSPTGHDRRRQRRKLSLAAPVLCPTQTDDGNGFIQRDGSPFGNVDLTSPSGLSSINLYDPESGYASSLFCQWNIKPDQGSSQLSLVFDKFDVPIGYDLLKVYQLKCTTLDCTRRRRTLILTFPTSFDDAGLLPPLVHLQELAGNPVHMTVRFTSRFASGSAGFIASYTSSQFEMMDAAPIMMPKSLGTDFYVSGAGFDATSTLCCKFEGLDNDVNDGWTPFIIANPPDGETNSSITCKVVLGDPTKYQEVFSFIPDPSATELPPGKYALRIARTSDRVDSITPNSQTIFVHAPPIYGNVTPGYAAFGDNVTLPLIGLEPWDTLDSGERKMLLDKGLANVKLRFITPLQRIGGGFNQIRVSTDVPATVVSTNGSLPLNLVFDVPMPLVGGNLLDNASQIHVALNGQQYLDSGTVFRFSDYCSGETVLTTARGTFYDHPLVSRGEDLGGGPPRPYSYCQWTINVDKDAVSPPARSNEEINLALQIEPGSLLQNVGFDSVTIYNSTVKSAATLVRKWPIDIADAAVVPDAFESGSNTMLVVFQSGGFSSSAHVYQGFSARYVATATGTMSTLQLRPNAASDNSSELMTIVVSISPVLLDKIDGYKDTNGIDPYKCKFVSKLALDQGTACNVPLGLGVMTTAAQKMDANTFTCKLPRWEMTVTNETVKVVLAPNPDTNDATLLCTGGEPLELLFFANPVLHNVLPSEGGVGTIILINGTGMLDSMAPELEGLGLMSKCRFERNIEVSAEWIDSDTIRCVVPVPNAPGPNPVVDVEVSNNGFDWSTPLPFTYKTYCGGTMSFSQSVGAFADHSGAYASLPNSFCNFQVAPMEENILAEGGVQLSFDTLDIGPEDTVKVYHTTQEGGETRLTLLMDVAAYYNEFLGPPPTSLLKSRKGGFHGLPVLVQYRTGPVTFTSGISVSYVTLQGFQSEGGMIYCPLPTLGCPVVVSNTGFSSNEARQTASRLQASSLASSSVQVAGMAMHYMEVDAPEQTEANDAYRIVEVEVHLVSPNSRVTVLVMEQPSLVESTGFSGDGSADCVDTTLGQALEACPKGDLAEDRVQGGATANNITAGAVVAEGHRSGGRVRLVYCLIPREERTANMVRLVVAVYGDSAAADEEEAGVVAYRIEYRDLKMAPLASAAEFTAIDGSLVSGGSGGAIGWMRGDANKILRVMARLAESGAGLNPGRLLIQRDTCPTRSDYLYSMQPNNDGVYGVSVADCNSTTAGCKTSGQTFGETVVWFVGLLSTAGEEVDNGVNTSLISKAQIDSADKGHGFSALCLDDYAPNDYTDRTCGDQQCTHLLTPSQTHHFAIRAVDPFRVLKVDACVVDSFADGANCLSEDHPGQLAISLSPTQHGSTACLTADFADRWPDATFADGNRPGGDDNPPGGVTQWPFQGHYRLSRCTGGSEEDWRVSVTARIGDSSAFVPYRLSVYYQTDRQGGGAPPIIDLTKESSVEVTTYAGDWSYFIVQGVSSDAELTVSLSMPISEISMAGSNIEQAAVELYLSDIACPDPDLQDASNYTAVTYPVLSTVGAPVQKLMVTRTLDPPENCSAAAEATTKTLYVGVKGASDSLLRKAGSKFTLNLGSSPLQVEADIARVVAVQGGSYVVLEAEVSTVYGLNVRVEVKEAAGVVDADALILMMMPKLDRNDSGCGAPKLLNMLRDPQTSRGTTEPGQSALPLVLTRGTLNDGVMTLALSVVESPACEFKEAVEGEFETWYIALRVPDTGPDLVYASLTVTQSAKQFTASEKKHGNLLKQQWAHFEVETVGEGTISLNVDTQCFSQCADNAVWLKSLRLVAKAAESRGCPNDDPDDKEDQEDTIGTFNAATSTIRFSVNLCTSGGGKYRIGIRGIGGNDDYPFPYQGGGIDYQISSATVAQTNMATFTMGQVLEMDMANGEWQYHYLEMPDPTCASRQDGCLKEVTTQEQAEACIETGDDGVQSVLARCINQPANFPATVQLTTRAVGGAPINGVRMYAAVGSCGNLVTDDNLVELNNDMFSKQYTSERLLQEYLLAQLNAIKADGALDDCDVEQVISCLQCAKRSRTNVCADTCCFTPKIYAGVNGESPIVTRALYELEPSLQCQGGYKQAGGTYADACEECEPGKYSPGGLDQCRPTPPGYYSPGGLATPQKCEVGRYSDVEGATECTPCGLGRYQASEGRNSCDECEVGKYNPLEEQTQCQDCPNTFTSQKGALALGQCFCKYGFFKPNMQNAESAIDACNECIANAICRGGCESNPSADKCSDEVWFPADIASEQKPFVLGGLEWIPKAMPYPTAGYFQELAYEPLFQGKEGFVYKLDPCERTGVLACWWPLMDEGNNLRAMIASSHVRIPNVKVIHNNVEDDQPWWLNDFGMSFPKASMMYATFPASLVEGEDSFGRSLQCEEKYWTYSNGAQGTGCASCLTGPSLYFLQGGKCTGCPTGFTPEMIVLGILCAIVIGGLLILLSKVGFNWAAVSISINFLQVSAIFANFSIEWPEEVLALLAVFKLFTVDVDAVNAECTMGRVSYFEKWIVMVLAPFIVVSMLSSISFTLEFATFIMGKTRFPTWIKRKMWRFLKPPEEFPEASEDDSIATKITKKFKNIRRTLFFKLLSLLTKPIPRTKLEALQDTIFNAFVTFLSVYYMTGVKRSLEVFRCINKSPILFSRIGCPGYVDGVTPAVTLIYEKQILFASDGAGDVECARYNVTTCEFEPPGGANWRSTPGPPTQGLFQLLGVPKFNSPNYVILSYMAVFFTTLYMICIPLFFFVQLSLGKHELNHLNFGRRYGYLYKRYEVQFYWWECTVMLRKSGLSIVDIFVGLDNGAYLPGQQAVAGMTVVLTFLLAQAAFTPYCEAHLDALETILLSVNYNFLFMGLCNYAIRVSSSTSPDQEMTWLLTVCMTLVLVMGLLFLALFLALDITLQLVRLYFRYIEGEGKYGKRQQLVLMELDKDTRRIQALSAKLLAPERRQLFQKWLNSIADDNEKLLTKAAFNSLDHHLKMDENFSMPWMVQWLSTLPLVGGLCKWIYNQQHLLWVRARERRGRARASKASKESMGGRSGRSSSMGKLRRSMSMSSSSSGSSSLEPSRAKSFLQEKSASLRKKVGGRRSPAAGASSTEYGTNAR